VVRLPGAEPVVLVALQPQQVRRVLLPQALVRLVLLPQVLLARLQ
jgi:hypothetical protein